MTKLHMTVILYKLTQEDTGQRSTQIHNIVTVSSLFKHVNYRIKTDMIHAFTTV